MTPNAIWSPECPLCDNIAWVVKVIHRTYRELACAKCYDAAQQVCGRVEADGTRRPVSRVLCRPPKTRASGGRGGHSSGPPIAGRFSRPTRTARAGESLSRIAPGRVVPIRSCSRRGLPCRLRCRRRGALLPHPFTLTRRRGARRFAFCGAVPGVTPGGRYPPPFRRGARTFLHPPCGEQRPPGRLVRSEGGRAGRQGQVQRGSLNRPISRERVSPSATPCTASGRQWRWKAVTTLARVSSYLPLRSTS